MVGVGQGVDGDFPGGIPRDAVGIDQHTHQLGNGNRGVRVVHLDRGVIGQRIQGFMHVQMASQQILQRRGDEEVLLAQAQFLTGFGAVVGVQHTGNTFCANDFGHRTKVIAGIEAFKVQVLDRPCPPQAQGVDARSAPADHRGVVSNGAHNFRRTPDLALLARFIDQGLDAAAEADRVNHLGTFELPRVTEVQPVLGLLLLPAIDHGLTEQAMLVTNTVTMGRDTEGRHALHEAGGQTTEAAVAQRSIRFEQANALQVHAQLSQCFTSDVQQAKVAQAVIEQSTDQELERQVVNPFLAFAVNLSSVVHPMLDHMVAGGQGDGFEPVMVKRVIWIFTHRISEFFEYCGTESGHLGVTNKRFL